MKRIHHYKEKRKLKVGSVYDFNVLKKIQLPEDDASFFVLKDPFDGKHLLPAVYYKNYDIQPLQLLKCHIDKVNCKGQLFLEPLHPYFETGKCYNFRATKKKQTMGKKARQYYVMEDYQGAIAYLPYHLNGERVNGEWISYRICKIKKAMVFLEESLSKK